MSETICRWGILGAATIARKNWQAIHDAGNATITAVASRSPGSATEFIAQCQAAVPLPTAPRATTYEELLQADDVDAIYLPIPTGVRIPWGLKAARNGKHILCEKPCAKSADELQELTDLCRSQSLQFMDGVMFMHTDRLQRVQEIVSAKQALGTLRRITSQFCFSGDEEFQGSNIRLNHALEPFGCLGDLGWYNIRLSLALLDFEMPREVTGRILRSDTPLPGSPPVPTQFSGELRFDQGISASFYCSFETSMQQWADISGDRGRLHIPDFVLPYHNQPNRLTVHNDEFIIRNCDFKMDPRSVEERIEQPSSNGPDSPESRMFQEFSRLVLAGTPDPRWSDYALKTQRVMDALLKSARAAK